MHNKFRTSDQIVGELDKLKSSRWNGDTIRNILVVMVDQAFQSHNQRIQITQASISRKAGVSLSTVEKSIRWLVSYGVLTKHLSRQGIKNFIHYTFNLSAVHNLVELGIWRTVDKFKTTVRSLTNVTGRKVSNVTGSSKHPTGYKDLNKHLASKTPLVVISNLVQKAKNRVKQNSAKGVEKIKQRKAEPINYRNVANDYLTKTVKRYRKGDPLSDVTTSDLKKAAHLAKVDLTDGWINNCWNFVLNTTKPPTKSAAL